MKYLFIILCAAIMPLWTLGQATVALKTKDSKGTGAWVTRQAKVVERIPDFVAEAIPTAKFNKYGSYTDIKTTATGFYYTKKIQGRWWIIDPDGYAGLNIAVNSMTGVSGTAAVQTAYDRLWELGFNGIGNFLSYEDQTKTYNATASNARRQMSYTRKINFFLGYKNVRRTYYPSSPTTSALGNSGLDHVFVLDPAFITYCDTEARKLAAYKNEPGLLGYFLDNEINFNQDQLYNLLNDLTDTNDPSYKAALAFITARGKTKAQVTTSDGDTLNIAFAGYLAERYYKLTDSLIKIYDPNHLNLGSRLHGRPRGIEQVVKASARHCDVVSVNFYDKFSPNEQITSATLWNAWVDKPCIVGEFYSKGQDAYDLQYVYNYHGAGYCVETQADRGTYYHNTCIELLQSTNFVGWHYFKYSDGDSQSTTGTADGSNKGLFACRTVSTPTPLVDANKEYTAFTARVQVLNQQRYAMLKHFFALDTAGGGGGGDPTSAQVEGKAMAQMYVFNRQLFIQQLAAPAQCVIVSTSGRPMHTFSVPADMQLSLDFLPSGAYIALLHAGRQRHGLSFVVN